MASVATLLPCIRGRYSPIRRVEVTLFWLTFVLLQALAGGYALRLDGERLRPLCILPLQQVVYRQLMYLVTIQSVITALIGTRQRWQAISRAGVFANPSA